MIKHRGKVFVADVLDLKVRHYLCGFGKLSQIKEIRSKSVVFDQASQWLDKNLKSTRKRNYESTSRAVASVRRSGNVRVAAIGTRSACRHHGVPIIMGGVQNKPKNVTLFFVIQRGCPNPLKCDHVLMCVRDASEKKMKAVEDVVTKTGCSISTGWTVHVDKNGAGPVAYFCELNGQYSNLDLSASVMRLTQSVFGAYMVGGYTKKCITSLML